MLLIIEEMLLNILSELATIGPIVALLIAAIIYFLKRENKKDVEIEELQEQLRESEKENLTALYKTTALFEKFTSTEEHNYQMLLKELNETRKSLEDKISEINKNG